MDARRSPEVLRLGMAAMAALLFVQGTRMTAVVGAPRLARPEIQPPAGNKTWRIPHGRSTGPLQSHEQHLHHHMHHWDSLQGIPEMLGAVLQQSVLARAAS